MANNPATTIDHTAPTGGPRPEEAALPVIDLARFACAPQDVADELAAACRSVGFVYVRGHGVGKHVIGRALAASRGFFARPAAEKQSSARRPGQYRGYIPVMPFSEDARGRQIFYEAFLLGPEIAPEDPVIEATGGLCSPNIWPDRPHGFQAALMAYRDAVSALSDTLLRAFALALGQDEQALLAHFARPLTNISLLHYPPRPDEELADQIRAHHDTNALTILLPGEIGGLEVLKGRADWVEVPPRPGCFVVNIGTMMERWSGGQFKSTMHRVRPPVGRDRYSIGYFATPDYETVVAPLPGVAVVGGRIDPIHAGRDFAQFVGLFDTSN